MNLLFRTDASVAIGTGHVMRCIALAQAWQDGGGRAVFVTAESTPAIQARLANEQCEVVRIATNPGESQDAELTIALAREQGAEWVVVDGYRFASDYQRALKNAGCKLLFLDDYGHAGHYSADLILNQNLGVSEQLYASKESYARLLIGPQYALLRREFASWRDWRREIAPVCRRLLVMMGGSDKENITARAIAALERFGDIEATVVVGGSNPHLAELRQTATRLGRKITLREDVTNMPALMSEADVALSAAGSTCWELCMMGLPALLIDVAENQTAVAKALDRAGCAIHIGDRTVDESTIAQQLERVIGALELRRSLFERSRKLVDGLGASRVLSALRAGSADVTRLRLRPVEADDARLLWEWANDPDVRASSFTTAPISWENHVAWLAAKLSQNATRMWIAENEQGTACGQIRFDVRADGGWETDISVAKELRGHGLAARLIAIGASKLREEHPDATIHAFVKVGNVASRKAFERAGFRRVGSEHEPGGDVIHFIDDSGEPAQS